MRVAARPVLTSTSEHAKIQALLPALTSVWRSARATPFQHPAWWAPWIDAFQIGEPLLAVTWRDGQVTGALPLYRTVEAGEPVFRIVGSGNTDYLDAILAVEDDETRGVVADWLDAIDGRLDVLDLPPDAVLTSVLARCRRPIRWAPCARCPVIELPEDPREWRQGLPHGLARNLPIAAQYVLVSGARAFSYLSGFDPAYARFRPGALLMAHAIEQAIEEGCRSFDLLRGEEPYKAQWATGVCSSPTRSVPSSSRCAAPCAPEGGSCST